MAKPTTPARAPRPASDFPIVPSAMPAGLVAAGAVPLDPRDPGVALYHFGALLLRIGDTGAIIGDVVVGFNYGLSQEQAQAEFAGAVRQTYPGCSITKVTGGEIPKLPDAAPEQG